MDYKTLFLEKNDGIATLTFNRPDKMNSVNQDMRFELLDALDALETDDDTRVVVFTGAGRGFCSGADISEFVKAETDIELQKEINKYMFQIAQRIYDFEKPTIGAINGAAAGDGAQYVLAFDLNVASEKAKFGWVATALGIV